MVMVFLFVIQDQRFPNRVVVIIIRFVRAAPPTPNPRPTARPLPPDPPPHTSLRSRSKRTKREKGSLTKGLFYRAPRVPAVISLWNFIPRLWCEYKKVYTIYNIILSHMHRDTGTHAGYLRRGRQEGETVGLHSERCKSCSFPKPSF